MKTLKLEKMQEEIITNEEINQAWGNADFGNVSRRDLIANATLKYASGFSTGRTIREICFELGLIGKNNNLTKRGRMFLYHSFKSDISV